MSLVKRLFGSRNERYLLSIEPLVQKINALEESYQQLEDEDLKGVTEALKKRHTDGESLNDILPEAFALVREGARRALGLRAFDVQLMGGVILHQGKVSEMKTGEGKTLVATFPAFLNALSGKGVHVVTVNDYLAKRDSEWMAQVYEFLGLTCSFIIGGMDARQRKEAYRADITYATNNELGFDYLRDNMVFSLEQRAQRGHNFAIVDEVDSILIDEARTPLIISGPTEDKIELYRTMDTIMPRFKAGEHFEVDEKQKAVTLTDAGMDKAEEILRSKNMLGENDSLYEMEQITLVHHLNQALRAHNMFSKDVDYIIKDGEVMLIDEFTGRMMSGRRLSEGLHQAIEAKEGVEIHNENQTLASTTFQNYFRMYNKLSGMTGTADTEAEEFESIYGLNVVVVPTHVPVAREDEADRIFRTKQEKMDAVVADIRECYERGQPVLVGTTSIEKSEELSELLKKNKVKHQVLNARYHEQEAEIVAQAGRLGAITIATNMAGRGTDIKLGGNIDLLLKEAETDAQKKAVKDSYEREKADVLSLGGLRVISTERHESRRIDNQLRGRSGRQGDPGSSAFYISLQDDLIRIFAPMLETWMEKLDMPEGEVIQHSMVSKSIERAQRKLEGRHFEFRKQTLKYDNVLNEQRHVIYEEREGIMGSETVNDIIRDFFEETLVEICNTAFPPSTPPTQWNVDSYREEMFKAFTLQTPIDEWIEEGIGAEELLTRSRAAVEKFWQEKEEDMGAEILRPLEKSLMLQVLDHEWKEHLQRLDVLRQGIHLRGYGQKDPLNEFKREAFAMFEHLLHRIREQTVGLLCRVEIREEHKEHFLNTVGQIEEEGLDEAPVVGTMPRQASFADDGTDPFADKRVGRNEPCPCGSGKKYKQCHGKLKAAS